MGGLYQGRPRAINRENVILAETGNMYLRQSENTNVAG